MSVSPERPRSLLLRVLFFTVLVPCSVVVWAPYYWIVGPARVLGARPVSWLFVPGVIFFAIGMAIYIACAWRFAAEGLGTPAPWDPPRQLVTGGLFRLARNPFYVGVVTMVLAEAALFASREMFWYALAVAAVFHLRVIAYEEPALRRLFGDEFERYAREVPRWVPRLNRRAPASEGRTTRRN